MKKRDVVTLMGGTLSALLLASGLCMYLIGEWNLKTEGTVFAAVGLVIGIAVLIYIAVKNGKGGRIISGRTLGIVLLSVSGALAFGGGMSLVMVYGRIFWGIVLGIAGIFLLMMLLPVTSGIEKKEN